MITITNLTNNIAKVSKKNDLNYILDYGEITKESEREIILKVDTDLEFEIFNTSAGCGGCTKVTQVERGLSSYEVIVEFHKDHPTINKKAYINYREKGDKLKRIDLQIKGNVI